MNKSPPFSAFLGVVRSSLNHDDKSTFPTLAKPNIKPEDSLSFTFTTTATLFTGRATLPCPLSIQGRIAEGDLGASTCLCEVVNQVWHPILAPRLPRLEAARSAVSMARNCEATSAANLKDSEEQLLAAQQRVKNARAQCQCAKQQREKAEEYLKSIESKWEVIDVDIGDSDDEQEKNRASKRADAAAKPPADRPLPVEHQPLADPPDISWRGMRLSMTKSGWKIRNGTAFFAFMYINPCAAHLSKKDVLRLCKEGVHYFTDENDVKRYAVRHLGWTGEKVFSTPPSDRAASRKPAAKKAGKEPAVRAQQPPSSSTISSLKETAELLAAPDSKNKRGRRRISQSPGRSSRSDSVSPDATKHVDGGSRPAKRSYRKAREDTENEGMKYPINSRVIVWSDNDYWGATIKGYERKNNTIGYSVNYDGYAKSRRNWVNPHLVAGLMNAEGKLVLENEEGAAYG
ncbi:hypothetical protein THAOC_12067 [Thalassiosira oceanica]|uniref:Uncharacterized protein n=1 Tax=Thalassiosira oceanica TaxID=159749 RepID=K0T8U7_THAOC|nr:hypothetical protein THAOC_12067 [Thalassiosira oceanica]|eukprot:EJK66957.1 hypothetical protein THAOC_12067 [Thalassiosira oceanica]